MATQRRRKSFNIKLHTFSDHFSCYFFVVVALFSTPATCHNLLSFLHTSSHLIKLNYFFSLFFLFFFCFYSNQENTPARESLLNYLIIIHFRETLLLLLLLHETADDALFQRRRFSAQGEKVVHQVLSDFIQVLCSQCSLNVSIQSSIRCSGPIVSCCGFTSLNSMVVRAR